jgi:RimJ/RimL family protein N-acetyltransferase
MIDFPSAFTGTTETLQPITALGDQAGQAIQQLADKGYEVRIGLTPEFAEAITTMTHEPAIRLYCPKDAGERFTDRAATERWLSKQRAMFLLIKRGENNQSQLAGYGWVGAGSSEHVPGGEITFAIRIGEIGQGQGLATPFAWLIVAAAAERFGAQNMWLETWGSNGAAVHVYHKVGFVNVAEVPSSRPVPDSEPVDDVRVYMTLANDLLPTKTVSNAASS